MKEETDDFKGRFYFMLAGAVIGAVLLAAVFPYQVLRESDNSQIINDTINLTLSTQTLMLEVTNQYNIAYLNQYQAIPIYVKSPFGTKVYSCSNLTEIK